MLRLYRRTRWKVLALVLGVLALVVGWGVMHSPVNRAVRLGPASAKAQVYHVVVPAGARFNLLLALLAEASGRVRGRYSVSRNGRVLVSRSFELGRKDAVLNWGSPSGMQQGLTLTWSGRDWEVLDPYLVRDGSCDIEVALEEEPASEASVWLHYVWSPRLALFGS